MNRNYIKHLTDILQSSGLSQQQLAKTLGVSFAALNRWVRGHSKPRQRRLVQIDRLFRELVGYPSLTGTRLKNVVKGANRLKIKNIWDKVAKNQNLLEELLLEHTYNSTSIEGTTFSKRQTEAIIFNKSIIQDKTLTEHLEVTNHATILREVLQKDIKGPISEKLIKRIHASIMHGLRKDAGQYSKHHRGIRGVNLSLTHPSDIPEEMGLLVKGWKRHPKGKSIQDIASFHSQFELIHPFGDGNGRVGRIIMVLQCLENQFPPVIIPTARKEEYYNVLEYSQKQLDGPFVGFLTEEMAKTRTIIQKYR